MNIYHLRLYACLYLLPRRNIKVLLRETIGTTKVAYSDMSDEIEHTRNMNEVMRSVFFCFFATEVVFVRKLG
jgi:hypothetical protein